jgi:A/G-specific adenine glycosylase
VLFPSPSDGVEKVCAPNSQPPLRRSRRLGSIDANDAIVEIVEIVDPLLGWGLPQLRDFPWRQTNNRWHVLVSEVMSQQTQVHRVVPKFNLFLEQFPTPTVCAGATLGELLEIWQGLGYPRRCRNLHEAAKVMVLRHSGEVPTTLEELVALPGVGDYTARAVMAFADHADVGVVDTNVARVLARVNNKVLGKKEVQLIADAIVPEGLGWEWNQVMMDFGATVCSARVPQCSSCVISNECGWKKHGGADPAPATAGTSKPQSRFEGSDRQARGKLMKALVAGAVRVSDASKVMGLVEQPERCNAIVQSLLEDGLIAQANEWYQQP